MTNQCISKKSRLELDFGSLSSVPFEFDYSGNVIKDEMPFQIHVHMIRCVYSGTNKMCARQSGDNFGECHTVNDNLY